MAAREKWPKSDFGRKLAGHLTGRKRGDGYSACKRSPSRAYAVTRPSTLPFKEPTNAKDIPGGCVIFAPGDIFAQPRKQIIARPRSLAARTPLLCLLFFFFSRERAATLHPPLSCSFSILTKCRRPTQSRLLARSGCSLSEKADIHAAAAAATLAAAGRPEESALEIGKEKSSS